MARAPEALRALHEEESDAAFIWLPIADAELAGADILTGQRMIALAPSHPLTRREKLSLADLRDEPVIGPHPDLPEEVMRFWNVDPRPDGSSPRLGPAANTPEECLLHVNAGRGIWPAPASTAVYFTQPSWPGGHWSTRRRSPSAWCGCGPHLPRSFRGWSH
ncbi:LysR substrate-binding domain-containing protein [Streptomyces viridochromogenes]|uniref:LysR substrate-binding domain-containing protein n=1 Tax=Streptomyces viridochromogenes TaxID=1938 RepID=UPI000A378B4D|nr:LysR substrate-binding domain-containing protein [Streptomyces viridochromogenes]